MRTPRKVHAIGRSFLAPKVFPCGKPRNRGTSCAPDDSGRVTCSGCLSALAVPKPPADPPSREALEREALTKLLNLLQPLSREQRIRLLRGALVWIGG